MKQENKIIDNEYKIDFTGSSSGAMFDFTSRIVASLVIFAFFFLAFFLFMMIPPTFIWFTNNMLNDLPWEHLEPLTMYNHSLKIPLWTSGVISFVLALISNIKPS